ncbi:hypothetical protein KIPB_002214 [Kipferlia bialata]|uniref:Uncharacterized protein n=1 Tax=Kipferlia bialata TaxID=797122 RepID=A0A9K3CSD2_9EUKA|nr:hypothetical protein KIPB_002214 [Kipferlia bialata]|eukprot:g2214.t1
MDVTLYVYDLSQGLARIWDVLAESNYLNDVSGLAHFSSLGIVDLSNNLLELESLQALRNTQIMDLRVGGNPLTDTERWRAQVVMLLPFLWCLEGVEVTQEERRVYERSNLELTLGEAPPPPSRLLCLEAAKARAPFERVFPPARVSDRTKRVARVATVAQRVLALLKGGGVYGVEASPVNSVERYLNLSPTDQALASAVVGSCVVLSTRVELGPALCAVLPGTGSGQRQAAAHISAAIAACPVLGVYLATRAPLPPDHFAYALCVALTRTSIPGAVCRDAMGMADLHAEGALLETAYGVWDRCGAPLEKRTSSYTHGHAVWVGRRKQVAGSDGAEDGPSSNAMLSLPTVRDTSLMEPEGIIGVYGVTLSGGSQCSARPAEPLSRPPTQAVGVSASVSMDGGVGMSSRPGTVAVEVSDAHIEAETAVAESQPVTRGASGSASGLRRSRSGVSAPSATKGRWGSSGRNRFLSTSNSHSRLKTQPLSSRTRPISVQDRGGVPPAELETLPDSKGRRERRKQEWLGEDPAGHGSGEYGFVDGVGDYREPGSAVHPPAVVSDRDLAEAVPPEAVAEYMQKIDRARAKRQVAMERAATTGSRARRAMARTKRAAMRRSVLYDDSVRHIRTELDCELGAMGRRKGGKGQMNTPTLPPPILPPAPAYRPLPKDPVTTSSAAGQLCIMREAALTHARSVLGKRFAAYVDGDEEAEAGGDGAFLTEVDSKSVIREISGLFGAAADRRAVSAGVCPGWPLPPTQQGRRRRSPQPLPSLSAVTWRPIGQGEKVTFQARPDTEQDDLDKWRYMAQSRQKSAEGGRGRAKAPAAEPVPVIQRHITYPSPGYGAVYSSGAGTPRDFEGAEGEREVGQPMQVGAFHIDTSARRAPPDPDVEEIEVRVPAPFTTPRAEVPSDHDSDYAERGATHTAPLVSSPADPDSPRARLPPRLPPQHRPDPRLDPLLGERRVSVDHPMGGSRVSSRGSSRGSRYGSAGSSRSSRSGSSSQYGVAVPL